MTDREAQPHLEFTLPTSSRIYDFALGGKDNFELDRTSARRLLEALPAMSALPRENRKFMRRAVRHLLDAGVRQFLDIGCGLPSRGNVHEIVHRAAPGAPVVYVDSDPVPVVHYTSLLHTEPAAAALRADARDPRAILEDPEVTRLIDFGRPVGVLMITVLAQIHDEAGPESIVAAFRDVMVPGSHLALCDITADSMSEEEYSRTAGVLKDIDLIAVFRPRERIAGFFDGLDLVEPGLVAAPEWRPDRPYESPTGWLLAGVGRKP